MAQLSLIWPYNIVDYETKLTLLHNIENHLLGVRGVRRYPGDVYCGKGLVPHAGQSAEWPLGLAWLAISYAKLAEHGKDQRIDKQPVYLDWSERAEYFRKAVGYFHQLESVMTPDGYVPEMYVGSAVGHNTPLAWAQSFHIIAAQVILNLTHKHPEHFRLPNEVRRGGYATI